MSLRLSKCSRLLPGAACLFLGLPPILAEVKIEAWYHLSDNAFPQDSSGHQRHFRNPLPEYTHSSLDAAGGPLGKPGFFSIAALEFGRDGTSGYFDNGFIPPIDNVGIELWVKPLGNGRTSKIEGLNWIFATGGDGGINVGVEIREGKAAFVGGLINRCYVGDPSPLQENRWTHLALIRDRGVSSFYVDGQQIGMSTSQEPANAGRVHLGVSTNAMGGFKGLIDEARIFTFEPGAFVVDDLLLRRAQEDIGNLEIEQAPASTYQIKTWQAEAGIPHHSVSAIAQTTDGYLWLGTPGGLARFDGRQFQVFQPGAFPELDSGRILSLARGAGGILWIVTAEGSLVRHNGAHFESLPWTGKDSPDIARALEDRNGQLWLATSDGKIGRRIGSKFDTMDEGPARLDLSPEGEVWIIRSDSIRPASTNPAATTISDGFLCIGSEGGFWQRKGSLIQRTRADITLPAGRPISPELIIHDAREDRHGRLWLATSSGVMRKDIQGGDIALSSAHGLPSHETRVIFEDSTGGIWIGTDGGGLSRLNPPLITSLDLGREFPASRVSAICAGDEDTLWAGTEKSGLYQFRNITSEPTRSSAEKISSVRSLAKSPDGRLFIGSPQTGLWEKTRDGITRPQGMPEPGNPVSSLFIDRSGALWIGPTMGREILRLSGNSAHSIAFPDGMPPCEVCVMAQDKEGGIWVGTDGQGLLRWQEGRWEKVGPAQGLISQVIWSLHADADGALWIGTLGGGLSRWKDGQIRTCTTRDGLHHDTITHLEDDGRGHFWCGSHQGIFRVRKSEIDAFADGLRQRVESVAYGLADGMASIECSGGFQPAGCQTSDGRIWFPTLQGIAMVNPSAIRPDALPPPVRIEGLSIDGAFRRLGPGKSSPLRLDTSHRRYRFHYASIDFTAPESLRFRTLLEGMDSDWVDAGPTVTADYSQLDAGRYTFRVQAAGRDGIWSEPGAAFRFEVQPRWWELPAIRAMLLFLTILAVGGTAWRISRVRLRRRLSAFEQQRVLELERRRIAANIHDDLGASLTRIALLSDLARDGAHLGGVGEEIDQIRETANELTRSMDEVVWAVAPEHDTIESLANYLSRVAQDLLAPSGLRCRLSIPTELPDLAVSGQVRHNLYLAVKEAIHNSIRHASATEVRLDLEVGRDSFVVTVMDNGRGFSQHAGDDHRIIGGHGVGNLEKRMRQIGGRCEIISTADVGTEVRLQAPWVPCGPK